MAWCNLELAGCFWQLAKWVYMYISKCVQLLAPVCVCIDLMQAHTLICWPIPCACQ